jgi:hypothetical protein
VLLSKEDQPQQTGKRDDYARVEQCQWADVGFKTVSKQQIANDKSEHYGACDANHPYREKRTKDINGRSAATSRGEQAKE